MKKPSTDKQAFYTILNRAVRKGEKVASERPAHHKVAGYSGKRTHQHKTGGALRK